MAKPKNPIAVSAAPPFEQRIDWPSPGAYVLAVSGGADSMVLLDLFVARSERYKVIVAHFNHGLRPDAGIDQDLVRTTAQSRGQDFVTANASLSGSSEAKARTARYAWLNQVASTAQALGVITAHHRDDVIETSLLNLARGTARKGLAPMRGRQVLRPLHALDRAQLRAYALERGLEWSEDSTNTELTNPRNFVRHVLLGRATLEWKDRYLHDIDVLATIDAQIDRHVGYILEHAHSESGVIQMDRTVARELSLPECAELIVQVCRRLRPDVELDERLVNELALFMLTGRAGKKRPIRAGIVLSLTRDTVSISATS